MGFLKKEINRSKKESMKMVTRMMVLMVIIIISMEFYSCKNDKCPHSDGIEHIYYPLSEDTALIRYYGDETLEFLKITQSDTDTVVFRGMGKRYYENTEDLLESEPCIERFHYQAFEILFKNTDTVSSMGDIIFSMEMFTPLSTEYFVFFKDREFSASTKFTINLSSYQGFIGSTTFNGQYFMNVSYLERKYNDIPERLYLNQRDGIIRMELNEFILQRIK